MGAFYESFQISSSDVEKVRQAIDNLPMEPFSYFLAPSINNWVSLYAEEPDENIGIELSRSLETLVLLLILHDSSVLYNLVYYKGEEIDTYCSCPDYFDPASDEEKEKTKGRPELWIDLLPNKVSCEHVNKLYKQMRCEDEEDEGDEDEYNFHQLRDLADALQVPNVEMSYDYLNESDVSDWGLQRLDEFIHVKR